MPPVIGVFSQWFYDELNRRIEEEIAERSLGLGRGTAPDFPEYRYAVGFNDGLRRLADLTDEIKQKVQG